MRPRNLEPVSGFDCHKGWSTASTSAMPILSSFIDRRGAAYLLRVIQLTELETEISDHVQGSPIWAEKEDLLASVPGIGPSIARSLIADLPELDPLIVARSRRWSASHPGPANPANGAARALSEAVDPTCGACCSWRHGGGALQPRPQAVPRPTRCSRQA